MLEIQQTLTFFAPTNDAFDRYYADTGSRHLSSDADHRSLYNPIIVDPSEVLLYHAYLKKVYYYNDLECNKQILSAVQDEYSTTECENNELVKFQVGMLKYLHKSGFFQSHNQLQPGLGDDGGSLGPIQKLVVFYRSPVIKYRVVIYNFIS